MSAITESEHACTEAFYNPESVYRAMAPSECDIRPIRRPAEGAQILQVNMLDHVIIGRPFAGR